MADLKPIPFGSKPLAPIPFGSKPLVAPVALPPTPKPVVNAVSPTLPTTNSKPSLAALGTNLAKIPGQIVDVSKKAGNAIIGSEKAFGEDIASAITAPEAVRTAQHLQDEDLKYVSYLIKQSKAARAEGKDSAHWDQLIKNYKPLDTEAIKNSISPALAKSNSEILGDAAGVGLDAVTAGTFGKAKAGATFLPKAGKILGDSGKLTSKTAIPTVISATVNAPAAVGKQLAENSAKKGLEKTIAAVNPDLTGKKLAGAYKEVVTGSRTTKGAKLFSEQTLSPNQQAINTATRLADGGIQLSNKPLKDLNTLKGALSTTETKIDALLAGKDAEVVYNADKPALFETLKTIKTTAPREFNAIKESKLVHDNVVDFARELVAKGEDSIKGLRDIRTKFDAQARVEYPNAFKDGAVDVKTPAGRAIKAVRDAINEHLYNTAPEGSEIRQLIQREADIFRATENIASKASKTHGKTIVEKVTSSIRKHPIISTAGSAAAGVGIAKSLGL